MTVEVRRVSNDVQQTQKAVKTWAYARVSTNEQNLSRQLDAFTEWGIDGDSVFCDKASGKDFDRPEYRRMLSLVASGDILVIKSIDRLGRNYDEIIEQWRYITKDRGLSIVVLDMPLLDTRSKVEGITGTFIADIVLQLFSYVAQIERENIKARQAEGIASAKARGVHCGRPRKPRPEGFDEMRQRYLAGDVTARYAASCLECAPSTFSRWVHEVEGL